MFGGVIYRILYTIVRVALFLWHPVFRVKGRENVPKDGRLVICCNHAGLADPIWVIFALGLDHVPRIMAKKELMSVPVLGWFLQKVGVFGVDRGRADIQAIKTGLRCLQNNQQLLLFPEGTRMRHGVKPEPKRGAVTLANRTGSPILPVFLSYRRFPFSPMTCVIGEAYHPQFAGPKATENELTQARLDLMDKIYAMEGSE